jgi:outer membrane protein OmpA-like peptidoglycan-associated protein
MRRQGFSRFALALVAAAGLTGLLALGDVQAYDHPQKPWIGSGTADAPAPADADVGSSASSDSTNFARTPAPDPALGNAIDALGGAAPLSAPASSGTPDSSNPTAAAPVPSPSAAESSSAVPGTPPATPASPTAPASPGAAAPSSASGAPALDISGRWLGTWTAPGEDGSRGGVIIADFVLAGSTGAGKIVLHDTMAAESLPTSIRFAGGYGVSVVLALSGSRLRVEHELGSDLATAVFEVHGDQMVGSFRRSRGPVRLVLSRVTGTPVASPAAPAEAPRVAGAQAAPATPDAGPQVAAARALPDAAPDTAGKAAVGAAPAPPAEAERHPSELHVGRLQTVASAVVTFAFNKADLNAEAQAALGEVAAQVQEHSDFLVNLEGYTDPVGTRDYNLQLSQRRATAVLRYLVEKGVELSRIHWVGLGVLSGPAAPEADAGKRRVTVTVLSPAPGGAHASNDAQDIRPSL